jgi:hypothetical protein
MQAPTIYNGLWTPIELLLLKPKRRNNDRGIGPVIARPRTEHGSGPGKFLWVLERTHSWLRNFRRLRVRFDRRSETYEACLKFGCSLVCWTHTPTSGVGFSELASKTFHA